MLGRPAHQKKRLRPRATGLAIHFAQAAQMFVAGRPGRSAHVPVKDLPAAHAHTIEDGCGPDPLPLQIPANASEHLLFAHPCFVLAGPIMKLLLPQHLTEVETDTKKAGMRRGIRNRSKALAVASLHHTRDRCR